MRLKLPRNVEFVAAIKAQAGAVVPSLPAPWGPNEADTTFISNWWLHQFHDAEDAITEDEAEARRTGKILIRPGLRIVMDFEDNVDPWHGWSIEKNREWAGRIKELHPDVKTSMYFSTPNGLVGRRDKAARLLMDIAKRVAQSPEFDEMSPVLYCHASDDGSRQRAHMANWAKTLCPGKPLSPIVWWYVKDRPYLTCTRDQFWRIQVEAALSQGAARTVILWGNLANINEQKLFEANGLKVIAG